MCWLLSDERFIELTIVYTFQVNKSVASIVHLLIVFWSL